MLFYHLKTGNNVLIDTWWNVNENTIVQEIDLSSFNRYMVECEFGSYANLRTIRHGFNRYMVECEFDKSKSKIIKRLGFNRYMVECEYLYIINYAIQGFSFNRYMVECELVQQ